MAVTIKDIARRVGLSVTTVSRALNDFDDVSAETKELIRRTAAEMGYFPNITARNLQKQRTNNVALILPLANHLRISDPFFSEFLSGLVETTTQSNFNLSLSTSDPENEREAYLRLIRSRQVEGFIVMRTQRQDSRIDLLRELDVPFVAFGHTEGDNDFPFVDNDDIGGIRLVIDHLVELGHTRLGFIAEPLLFTKSYNRLQGFLQGLEAHGLEYEPDLVVEANFRQRSGKISAETLLSLPQPPTAIIACNDLLALGALSAAQEDGKVVGRDISITGYDNIMLAEYATPPLTTVHQPAHELGTQLATLLLKIIRKEPVEEKHLIVAPSLIIRQSTAPPTSNG